MARPLTSPDGRPRVRLTMTISAHAHDFIMTTQARLKARNPTAHIGNAVESLADFAKERRFDPVASLKKTMRPITPSTAQPVESATPSRTKG